MGSRFADVGSDLQQRLAVRSWYADKSQEHPMQGLKRAAEALQEGAERYRREHGRPFVLVIDNIDRLAAHEPRVRGWLLLWRSFSCC